MEKELKNLLYAGVDLAAAASEKFQKGVNELVDKGSITPEDGKKWIDEMFTKTEERKAEFEKKYKEFTSKFKTTAKKDAEEEVDELRKKLADLEAKLAKNKAAGNSAK